MKPFEAVLNMAQTMLQSEYPDGSPPRNVIGSTVEKVLELNKVWKSEVNPESVLKELETRFNIWIGRPQILSDEDDHVQWLTAEEKNEWRYWPRYRRHLELGGFSPAAVDSTNDLTDRIVGLLEKPSRDGPWDRRGLVVGHVQSGKTSNYTGLICKAADAGYKVIIVLAGLHNNLRSQTQLRLEEGFLGYETSPTREPGRIVGVGLQDGDWLLRPDCITHRGNNGDLNRTVIRNQMFHPGERPLLFVVKKNSSVLNNLLSWIEQVAERRHPDSGQPLMVSSPLLLIDDEADHASVDTGLQAFNENGEPDEEHNPKRINSQIRMILRSFDRSAYVGYTATPFANIFIHDRGWTADEGDDLFPRSFIINLPAPSNYAGPVRIFGLEPDDEIAERVNALDLVRHVDDHANSLLPAEQNGWIPPRHNKDHIPLFHGSRQLPPSLVRAMYSFILATAARRARGQTGRHNSMLIHVTRFKAVQNAVKQQVEEAFGNIRNAVRYSDVNGKADVLDELQKLWLEDFEPTTRQVRSETEDNTLTDLNWREVSSKLVDVVEDIHMAGIREINGSSGDILDYEDMRETGVNLIAIGGDKLARGLTMEGLTVSYFLRATRMYDTLMQMGRWFGYRPAHIDLCRLYLTPDLEDWFRHITEASEELRKEFDHMLAVGGTPKDYGLRVQSHPTLMVTSRVKMRHHSQLSLSFSGSVNETVVFHREPAVLSENLIAVERLLQTLGKPSETGPVRNRPSGRVHTWNKSLLWNDCTAKHILSFLERFRTHETALRVNNTMLADYIRDQQPHNELAYWTVALLGGGEGDDVSIAGHEVSQYQRQPNTRSRTTEAQMAEGRYIIRRLLGPRDEAIDLEHDEYAVALKRTVDQWRADPGRSRRRTPPDIPLGPQIRAQRPARNGLLLLYPLDPQTAGLEHGIPVMGFGLSFPNSPNARTVSYSVNNIYWSQEYTENS